MTSYDCIVVGAGPGGATAARALAAENARVLLVDRAAFPRDKPCGGGVLISAARRLPFSLDSVTERTITGVRISYRQGTPSTYHFDSPLALMTQRSRLDALLAERAVAAGATLQDGRAVTTVEWTADAVRVGFRDGGSASARALVAADGANGVVRRALEMPPLRRSVALEANAAGVPDGWADTIGLDLGSMGGGYGWVFPKGDHCNVGVGGWPAEAATLREKLTNYASAAGFDPAALYGRRGYHLPLRDAGTPVQRGPVAFVGDAAGLIDPLSGEGIGNAIYSAGLAAEAIGHLLDGTRTDLRGYQRAVERKIDVELRAARQFQALFHQRPWPYVQLLRRSDRFWRTFCRIVRGEGSYRGLRASLGPLAFALDAASWYAERGTMRRSGWA